MASEGLFRSVFEGCIVGPDLEIERRPYHRNCNCALHNRSKNCAKAPPCNAKVSFPVRRSWSDSCLVMAASASSPSSSPSLEKSNKQLQHRKEEFCVLCE